ncbi:MAG TPA: hypothetical protein VFQ06_01480 [Nitrospira sp.]|nr:hypothetical protein [Nitrospira sp.]
METIRWARAKKLYEQGFRLEAKIKYGIRERRIMDGKICQVTAMHDNTAMIRLPGSYNLPFRPDEIDLFLAPGQNADNAPTEFFCNDIVLVSGRVIEVDDDAVTVKMDSNAYSLITVPHDKVQLVKQESLPPEPLEGAVVMTRSRERGAFCAYVRDDQGRNVVEDSKWRYPPRWRSTVDTWHTWPSLQSQDLILVASED